MRSLSSDSDRGIIFPDGSIHGDTHVTCPILQWYTGNKTKETVIVCLSDDDLTNRSTVRVPAISIISG